MILVDYRCGDCGGRSEHMVRNPAPPTMTCPACRGAAERRFSPVGLGGRARPPSAPRPAPRRGRTLCQDNPDVPGLCHMTEDAGRMWVARARGDNRALDRELERQERARTDNPGAPAPEPMSHDHGSGGHSHGTHTHTHTPAPTPAPSGPPRTSGETSSGGTST